MASWSESSPSRQAVHELFVNAPVPMCVLSGPDLVHELANARYCAAVGVEDVVGRTLADAVPGLAEQGLTTLLRSVRVSGEAAVGADMRLPEAGAAQADSYWRFTCAPLPDEGAVTGRVMAVGCNVTDRVRQEQAQEQTIAEMQHRIQLGEAFVGLLGHDLRNPLSAILTITSLLSRRIDPTLQPHLARMLSSANRMRWLIDQLADVARARLGGGIPVRPQEVDLAALCQAAVEELENVWPCRIQLETRGDLTGSWDGNRLSQLLSNLCGNACQHGTQGHPVTLRVDGSETGRVAIEVHNAGALPEPLEALAFDPIRPRGRTRARRTGLGLGLYISQQIVAAHGGELRAESSEASGTRLFVNLPRTVPVARLEPAQLS